MKNTKTKKNSFSLDFGNLSDPISDDFLPKEDKNFKIFADDVYETEKKIAEELQKEELLINGDELRWDGIPNFRLTEMSTCLQNIIVESYLTGGAYGLVYKVKYENMNCVMKVIPILTKKELPIKPLIFTSTLEMVEQELNTLDTLNNYYSNQIIAPKIYLSKICNVKFPKVYGSQKIKIVIIIMELLKNTLFEYNIQNLKILKNYILDNDSKNFIKTADNLFQIYKYTDLKIKLDLMRGLILGIHNIDVHSSNVMFNFNDEPLISDWGLIRIVDSSDKLSIKNILRKDTFEFTEYLFITQILEPLKYTLSEEIKNYLLKIEKEIKKLNEKFSDLDILNQYL